MSSSSTQQTTDQAQTQTQRSDSQTTQSNHGAVNHNVNKSPQLRVTAGEFQPRGQHIAQHTPSPPVDVSTTTSREPRAAQTPPSISPSPTTSARSRSNANHLLNFQHNRAAQRIHGTDNTGNRRRHHAGPKAQPYDRSKFLQANFRFLVSDAIAIRRYITDPDLMLDWEDIAQVDFLATHYPVVCPITLEEPLCPHITPCGHIFAFPAIMAHMRHHGGPELRKSSPCPLCFTHIAARELRPVVIRYVTPPTVGQQVKFTLLKRPKESIIPEPVDASTNTNNKATTPSTVGDDDEFIDQCSLFAKFTTVSDPLDLWKSEARRLAHYASQVVDEGGLDAEYEIPNVIAAMDTLAKQARAWAERRQRNLLQRSDSNVHQEENVLTPEEAGQFAMEAVKNANTTAMTAEKSRQRVQAVERQREEEFPALGSSPPGQSGQPTVGSWGKSSGVGHATISSTLPKQPLDNNGSSSGEAAERSQHQQQLIASESRDESYYFYQAADGQLIFLCPLNIKMLLQQYTTYADFPTTLTAKIIEIEDVVQNAATRKRMKSLSHLAATCSFKLCEVDLTSVVDESVVASFASEIAERERKRKQRVQREAQKARRESAAAAALAAKSSGPSAAELRAMPLLSASLNPPGTPDPSVDASGDVFSFEGEGGGGVDTSSATLGTSPDAPSFARIAALGFAATGPTLGNSPPGPDLRGLYSEQLAAVPKPRWGPASNSANTAATTSGGGGNVGAGSGDSKTPSKKKGGKQFVLLSSSSQRRY